MNEMQPALPKSDGADFHRKSDLIDVLTVLFKRKKMIGTVTLAAAVISAAVSFVLPNAYKSSTKLLPPQQSQSGAAALLSQLGGVAGTLAASGIKAPNDLYLGMLKSRTISDKLIKRFNLQNVYGYDSVEKTRKILEENTLVSSAKDGLILIEVEDVDKDRARQLANGYVEELMTLTKTLAVTEASQRRLFFEQQLLLSKDNLAKAERKLNSSLDTNGVISVDADSRAIVETVGRLRAQIAAKEIELSSMKAFVTSSNNEYKRVEESINSLRSELSKLQNGRPANAEKNADQSRAGLENIQTLRDLKYYQMLYELLAKQYEVARLDEAKDAAIIQVLDPANLPENRSKPRRSLIVLGAAAFAFLVAMGAAVLLDAARKVLCEPGRAARWKLMRSYL